MTAGPSSPGVGPPLYQPAGKPVGGTSKVPSGSTPSSISAVSTPIAGICRRIGVDLDRCGASGVGVATGVGKAGVGKAGVGVPPVARAIGGTEGATSPRGQPTPTAVPTTIMATTAAPAR